MTDTINQIGGSDSGSSSPTAIENDGLVVAERYRAYRSAAALPFVATALSIIERRRQANPSGYGVHPMR